MEEVAGGGAAERVARMEERVHDAAAEVDGEEADDEEGEEDESEDDGEGRSGVIVRGEGRVGEIGGHWPEKGMEDDGGGGRTVTGRRRIGFNHQIHVDFFFFIILLLLVKTCSCCCC